MPNKDLQDKRIDHIYKLVEVAYSNLEKVRSLLENLDKEADKDKYKDVPGVTGVFDGAHLVTESGEKLDVPTNYSAKSRLVFGDTLKMVEEEGKQIFKQIDKVKRRKIEGILTRKEGKWYILADAGTYKVSDIAADFYGASLNDEAAAFIPEENLNTPFATLDRVKTKESKEMNPTENVATLQPIKEVHATAPVAAKPAPRAASAAPRREPARRSAPRPMDREDNRPDIRTEAQKAEASRPPRAPRSAAPRRPANKEYVADIVRPEEQAPSTTTITNLGDDDLR